MASKLDSTAMASEKPNETRPDESARDARIMAKWLLGAAEALDQIKPGDDEAVVYVEHLRAQIRKAKGALLAIPAGPRDYEARLRTILEEGCHYWAGRVHRVADDDLTLTAEDATDRVILYLTPYADADRIRLATEQQAAFKAYIESLLLSSVPKGRGNKSPRYDALTRLFGAMGVPQDARQYWRNKRREWLTKE